MNSPFKFIGILLAVLAIAGCAPPFGSVGGTLSHDSIWAVPYRVNYEVNDLFVQEEDLLVFGSRQGSALPIAIDKVTIGVVENPSFPNEITAVPPDGYYLFASEGRKSIVITYGGLSTRYSIVVLDPFGIGGGNGNGQNGDGITSKWWDDP